MSTTDIYSADFVPKRSPWGTVDSVRVVAPGVAWVGTSSHGGIKLDRSRNAAIPNYLRNAGGWYEEDCDWAKAIVGLGQHWACEYAETETRDRAVTCLLNWNPEAWATYTGTPIDEIPDGQSYKLDRDRFHTRHSSDLIAISAAGDWHHECPEGMVLIWATVGGKREILISQRRFLVDAQRYKGRNRFGYVVNENLDTEVSLG